MGRAKDIIVKPIAAKDANRIVRALHYSGKVVQNSQVHFGVFLGDRCGGALQFGPSLDKRKLVGLVEGTKWNEFIELNRMAMADWLPRNGESRAIAVAMRLLKRAYPWLQWVVSFADACQCGDGTIYRASGFVLTGIVRNSDMCRMPDGRSMSKMSLSAHYKTQQGGATSEATSRGASGGTKIMQALGGELIPGYQLRYLYFLDPTARERLTVPIIPFSEIERRGAGMYRGKPRAGSVASDTPADQAGKGGAIPTPALSTPKQST